MCTQKLLVTICDQTGTKLVCSLHFQTSHCSPSHQANCTNRTAANMQTLLIKPITQHAFVQFWSICELSWAHSIRDVRSKTKVISQINSLIKHNALKKYGEVEVQFNHSLPRNLMEVSGQIHAPAALPQHEKNSHCVYCIGGWVGLSRSRPCGKEKKIYCSHRKWSPEPWVVHFIV
jgi:hypothetical protein